AALLHRGVVRLDLRFLLEAIVDYVIGMELHQALGDVLLRPRDQRRADRSPTIELERIRPRQFHRTSDPPAAARRRVERVLSVAIVAKDADAAFKRARIFRFRDGIDEQLLESLDPCFIGACLLRYRE